MDNFHPNNSFEISNSKDFFKKLCEEYNDFDKQHLNSRFAINCAINSWHLTDWTFQEFYKNHPDFQDSKIKNKTITGLVKYQEYLKKDCPELEYMRLITNGSKHCKINPEHRTIVSSGQFSPYDFSRHDFSVPRFVFTNKSDVEIDFEKTLLKTIDFWRNFMEKHYQ